MFTKYLVVLLVSAVLSVNANCWSPIDIIFARDQCDGIGSNTEWNNLYNLAVSISSKLGLSNSGVQVGILDFGNNALTRLPISGNLQNVVSALSKWPWADTWSCNPDVGINLAVNNFQTTGRANVPKLLVIFSATPASSPSNFVSAAVTAQVSGVTIMVIAADSANPQVLQKVITNPSLYYYGNSFSSLMSQVPSITTTMCNATNSSTSTGNSNGNNNGNGNSNTNTNTNTLTGNSGNNGNNGNANSNMNTNTNTNTNGGNSGNSGSGNSGTGNSGNSGNGNSNMNSNGGNSGSNGNSNGNSNSNMNTNTNTNTNSNGGSSSGGNCGNSPCPSGDQCCSDGVNPSNPYYCCTYSQSCCTGRCCNSAQGYQCYNGACQYGLQGGKSQIDLN